MATSNRTLKRAISRRVDRLLQMNGETSTCRPKDETEEREHEVLPQDLAEEDQHIQSLSPPSSPEEQEQAVTFDQFFGDSSSSSESEEEVEPENDDANFLANLRESLLPVPRSVADNILAAVRMKVPWLPRDSRTLQKTPRSVHVEKDNRGSYFSFCLPEILSNSALFNDKRGDIVLQLSADGIPLYRSSSQEAWVLSCRLLSPVISKPFILRIYVGQGKPEREMFLVPVVNELSILLDDGIMLNNGKRNVSLHSIIADAPARSFLRASVGHNHRLACERCSVQGTWEDNRMLYPTYTARPRTDESFRYSEECEDVEHRNGDSPLLRLPGHDIVRDFPLDILHLVFLGVVRKLIFLWHSGPLRTRIPLRVRDSISEALVSLSSYVPSCFSRKFRSFRLVKYWKSTEYSLFLYYAGVVVLQNPGVPKAIYENFLLLSSAMWLLRRKPSPESVDTAEKILEEFVSHSKRLYGDSIMTFNFHSIRHLCEDVRFFGSLENIQAYPFESFLYKVKRRVRTGSAPLVQIIKRTVESTLVDGGVVEETDVRSARFVKGRDRVFDIGGAPFLVKSWRGQEVHGVYLDAVGEISQFPFNFSRLSIQVFAPRVDKCVLNADLIDSRRRLFALPLGTQGNFVLFPLFL